MLYLQKTYPDKYKGDELEGTPGTFRFKGTEPREGALTRSNVHHPRLCKQRRLVLGCPSDSFFVCR